MKGQGLGPGHRRPEALIRASLNDNRNRYANLIGDRCADVHHANDLTSHFGRIGIGGFEAG